MRSRRRNHQQARVFPERESQQAKVGEPFWAALRLRPARTVRPCRGSAPLPHLRLPWYARAPLCRRECWRLVAIPTMGFAGSTATEGIRNGERRMMPTTTHGLSTCRHPISSPRPRQCSSGGCSRAKTWTPFFSSRCGLHAALSVSFAGLFLCSARPSLPAADVYEYPLPGT